jgi:iron complex transport system substrate-binding protein
MAQIEENILAVGKATDRSEVAASLVQHNRARIAEVVEAVRDQPPRRVVFLEWTDPLFCGGHWVPEMITLAGGHDPLGRPGADSERMTWEEVRAVKPEMIFVAPCGYGIDKATEMAHTIPSVPGATVYAVDANAYFARPGPRVAEGVELLAHLMHPARCGWAGDGQPWVQVVD